MICWQTKRKQT